MDRATAILNGAAAPSDYAEAPEPMREPARPEFGPEFDRSAMGLAAAR